MILAITETHVPLSLDGLGSLLMARLKMERIREYDSTLLHALVKRYYKDSTSPRDYADSVLRPLAPQMSKQDIIDGLMKKLG